MTIVVFGATGQVGLELVKQGLWKGHQVRAFGRNVHELLDLGEAKDNLHLIKGALFDEGDVLKAIKGCDAVLSAIGGGIDGTDKTRSLGMKNIVKQMAKAGVNRIVAIGGMGVLNGEDGKMLLESPDYPAEYLTVGLEHKAAYETLAASGLDWTFVCPPDIKNAAPTGTYHTAADHPPSPNQYRIGTGDLALFMLNELEQNEFVQKRAGISGE
jgi:putative NADH-flavin reductase